MWLELAVLVDVDSSSRGWVVGEMIGYCSKKIPWYISSCPRKRELVRVCLFGGFGTKYEDKHNYQ